MNDDSEYSEYQELVAFLGESGALGAGWRGAFLRTPRSLFVPERIWIAAGPSGYRQVTKRDDPEAWRATVNADAPVVTQLDDGEESGPGVATSSVSMPSLVGRMLAHLDVRDGTRSVLEIGSGWTTGLLCSRVGARRVVSVEIDPQVAERARKALALAGHAPVLVVGDGTRGFPERAPYDRVSSTAAVRRVPPAWVAQTKPGGVIVTPWGTPFCNAGLLKLHVREGEEAEGRFVDSVSFMWVRGQRPGAPSDAPPSGEARYGPSAMNPESVLESVHAAFAVGLHLPTVRYRVVWDESDPRTTRRLVLWDGDGSRATVFLHDWKATDAVRQTGPRNVWDEATAARAWWESEGEPELTRFGVTATADTQHVWLDQPSRVVSTWRVS
ncbi:protein-L-isoaspartate(D-aspartate) O-methyltransferase [Streptomyces sp. 891-h]|uniref:protein-L-isoaspartate(D-aspartate) O-methyltransferase n=1 Tax=Streptomyces sp. 891-h TaxID=2720714 RepID=UPI001FAB276F|nr:protein-L-isoaspartate(D-aspartate) O-methyltransferase [Streptomyces sp. 891-h]UNZ19072.1 protein-L-isoaspartate(D-aspartate) O-methyltransferase [Streptomyces sp. 891-h]